MKYCAHPSHNAPGAPSPWIQTGEPDHVHERLPKPRYRWNGTQWLVTDWRAIAAKAPQRLP